LLSTASDLLLIVFVLLVAFVFFGAIPGLGAFSVRARWRRFRARMLDSSLRPFVRYGTLTGEAAGSEEDGSLGPFRAFGTLEAMQGPHRIWINTGRFSVGVDLEGVGVYLLPSFSGSPSASVVERLELSAPEEAPAMVSWDRIYSLPAGTQVFVDGFLFVEDGQGVFRARPRDPLLVVIYDGEQRTILQRAVWSGRQKNEYWNQFTLAALLTGSFLLALLAYLFLRVRGAGIPALISLCLAAFPVGALLPPGVLLYFLYRHFWKRARLLRAERDMLRMPLRHFLPPHLRGSGRARPREVGNFGDARESSVRLPTGELYVRSREFRWLVDGPLAIRGTALVDRAERREQPYWLFGAADEAAQQPILRPPQDPMAELVLVLGDPEDMARTCSRRARIYEIVSAALFFAAVSLNLFLLFIVWHIVIR
jgi:hypothetical protein